MNTYRLIVIILITILFPIFSKPPVPREIRKAECSKELALFKSSATSEQRYRNMLTVMDCTEFIDSDNIQLLVNIIKTDTSVNTRLQALVLLKRAVVWRIDRETATMGIRIAEADPAPDIRFTVNYLFQFKYRGIGDYYEVLEKCGIENIDSFYEIAKGAGKSIVHIDRIENRANTVFPRLISFITDTTAEQDLRSDAVLLLGQIGEKEKRTVPVLLAALNDKNWMVRKAAATAFRYRKTPTKEIISCLVRAMENDPVDEVSSRAADALGTFQLDSSQISFILPTLLSKIETGHFLTRINSVGVLAGIGNRAFFASQAMPYLISVLKKDRDKSLRIACLYTLASFKEAAAPAVPVLVTMLNERDGELRFQVVETLGKIGPSSAPAVPKLINLIETTQECDLLLAAIETLGEIGETSQTALPDIRRVFRQAGNVRYSKCDASEIKSLISRTLNKIQSQNNES